jgi:hypothetical protein
MHVAAIKPMSRQRRQFKERGAGVDRQVDALPRQHLATRPMACAGGFAAAAGYHLECLAKFGDETAHRVGVTGEIGGARVNDRF